MKSAPIFKARNRKQVIPLGADFISLQTMKTQNLTTMIVWGSLLAGAEFFFGSLASKLSKVHLLTRSNPQVSKHIFDDWLSFCYLPTGHSDIGWNSLGDKKNLMTSSCCSLFLGEVGTHF